MSKPIKKCQICHQKFEQSFKARFFLVEVYGCKQTLIEFEALTPYASKELHQEIVSLCQELNALEEKVKPIRKELAVLLENFFQKKLNLSFIKSVISYLEEKGDESISKVAICKLCGQEVEQQQESIIKKLEEIEKDSTKLWDKSNRIRGEIEKKVERENLELISSETEKKVIKEALAELKSLLEKPSESTQQDSKPQSNQTKTTNHTPWIIGGTIGGGLTIGLVVWLVWRKKSKNARN